MLTATYVFFVAMSAFFAGVDCIVPAVICGCLALACIVFREKLVALATRRSGNKRARLASGR